MADHFLTKTPVAKSNFVQVDGQSVLERHAEFKTLLRERAGPEVAALFAEPLISMGNDEAPATVSWYTKFEGTARDLASLSGSERTKIETYLSDHLQPLRALADDSSSADLVGAALQVSNEDFVRVVGGHPVIIKATIVSPRMETRGLTLPLTLIRVVLGIYRTADQQFG